MNPEDELRQTRKRRLRQREWQALNTRITQARCPQCNDAVFIPSVHWPPDNPDDPIVWCRDMGHFAGRLSACATPKEA